MPSSCSRRDVLHYGSLLSVGGTSAFAGCTSEPAGGDGRLDGHVVTTVPQDATVVRSGNERIAEDRLLQSFIRETIRTSDASQELDEQEVDEVSNVLSSLPRYESNRQTDAPSGYYIKQKQTVVVLELVIRQ